MAVNRGKQYREVEPNPKNGPSSDCRLKLAYMKLELLVIADQHAAVNTFPGLVHEKDQIPGRHFRVVLANSIVNAIFFCIPFYDFYERKEFLKCVH